MSNEPSGGAYRICQAMLDAGITDPNSQKGIDFCVNKCPYDRCVAMEGETLTPSRIEKIERNVRIINLRQKGWTIRKIAKGLGVSYVTVQKILRDERNSQ